MLPDFNSKQCLATVLLILGYAAGMISLTTMKVSAQMIQVNVNLLTDGFISNRVGASAGDEAEILGVSRYRQVSDDLGRILYTETGSCLQLAAPDQVTVLVSTGWMDRSGRVLTTGIEDSQRTDVETRYINDGLGCPFDFRENQSRVEDYRHFGNLIDISRRVSRPVESGEIVSFSLFRSAVQPRTRSAARRWQSSGHLVLIERTASGGEPIGNSPRGGSPGFFLIDIEYL